jgi:hypothetical protein
MSARVESNQGHQRIGDSETERGTPVGVLKVCTFSDPTLLLLSMMGHALNMVRNKHSLLLPEYCRACLQQFCHSACVYKRRYTVRHMHLSCTD